MKGVLHVPIPSVPQRRRPETWHPVPVMPAPFLLSPQERAPGNAFSKYGHNTPALLIWNGTLVTTPIINDDQR